MERTVGDAGPYKIGGNHPPCGSHSVRRRDAERTKPSPAGKVPRNEADEEIIVSVHVK